jgi:hypothetical protein
MTEDKQIVDKNLPEDIVILGLGESLLKCDSESFKEQIEGLSQDELKKLLKDDDTSEDIMKDLLQRYLETISIGQKESKILNIDTKVENSGSIVVGQHIKYDDEFDRLMHMPDHEFKQEIVSMSDNGFERYMKKLGLSSWQKADVRGKRNERL